MYIRVERESYFGNFIERCLSAYERRTDVMRDTSEAEFQRRIDEITADLQASNDQLQGAIDQDKEK